MPTPILILASHPQIRSQLSLLLRELGHTVHVCTEAEQAIRYLETGKYRHVITERDTTDYNCMSFLQHVQDEQPETRVMLIVDESASGSTPSPFGLKATGTLAFPFKTKTALSRLAAFCESDTAASLPLADALPPAQKSASPFDAFRKDRQTRSPFPTAAAITKPRPPSRNRADAGTDRTPAQTNRPAAVDSHLPNYQARYLLTRCRASRILVSNIWKARNFKVACLVSGETGSEFELVARELVNATGDTLASPLFMHHEEIDMEMLATLNASSNLTDGPPKVVFIPNLEMLSSERLTLIKEFLERNQRSVDKHVRLMLGYARDVANEESETWQLLETLMMLCEQRLDIEPLRERRSEIPYLVHKIISDLTTLHPFLKVRGIEPTASDYLKGYLWRGNFEQLVTVLRSAVVGCPSRYLSMQQLEPLMNSDLTTFHLLESAADEQLLNA